jgi:hypothetical protein
MHMNHPYARFGSALAFSLSLAGAAHADPMIYTYQVNASGQLNGQPFTNADVTMTLAVESTNFAWDPAVNIAIGVLVDSSLIEVAGIGSDSFANTLAAISSFVNPYVGFGEPVSDTGIFFVEHPSALTWSMQTPLGPISGEASGNPGLSFATLGGSFTFDSFTSEGRFQAVFAPVPEPAAGWLMLAGMLGVAGRAAQVSRARRGARVS